MWQTPPTGQTPPGQTPPSEDTPRADTPAQCMLGYTPTRLVHAGIHTPPPSACWDTHSPFPVHAGIHTPPTP